MTLHRLVLPLLSALVACGGSQGEKAAPGGAAAGPSAESGAQARLQGTWEIVRYESEEPIPAEAMPMMGELFDSMRLAVRGDKVVVDERESPFVAREAGDGTFELATSGGMFDQAKGRFLSDDSIEIDDRGRAWPGKSVLKRVP